MGECVFCKIINKEIESKIIYETESIISFLDIDPINEGHVLIIPKVHVDSIEKVSSDVLGEILVLDGLIQKGHLNTLKKLLIRLERNYNLANN